MRNSLTLFLLANLVLVSVSSLCGQPDTSSYPYHQDFAVTEMAGVQRVGEPVHFKLPITIGSAGTGAPLLWNRTNRRQVPAQMTPRPDSSIDVLLVVDQPAFTRVEYRLYYGNPKPGPAKSESLKISGEDLAWQVENEHLIVDFTKNPGTGRSGQINRIFAKQPGIWLSRERDQSTLHLSPNAAGREHYLPVNRWNPPESWTGEARPLSFSLERSGPMPRLPQLHARIVYEVYADSPLILVEEEIEARQPVDLTLLRVGEFTFAPDPKNPFTNLVWGKSERAFEAGRNENPDLPVDIDWLGFIHRPSNYGFISILTAVETSNPAGGPALLLNPTARFSGSPAHYFWRAWITNNSDERGPAVTIPAGSRYRLKYWLYWLEPGRTDPLKACSDVWKAVKNPLQVELFADDSNGDRTGPFGVRRQKESRPRDALRALHWLGRDFSFLVPGEDGAALRALAHELELAEEKGSNPDLEGLLGKAEAVLRRHNLATRMQLSAVDQPVVPQTLALNLGCGPSPVVLEIVSGDRGAQVVSRDVALGPAGSRTEEVRLELAGTTWLILKVSGRPEGGESKQLRLTMGGKLGELRLSSNETPLSTVQVSFHDAVTGLITPVAVQLYAATGQLVVPSGALDFGKLGFLYEEDRPVHYADWSSPRVRSRDPHFGSSFFRSRPLPESACFYVDGELTTRLPPGSYRLTATRGLEYKPSRLVMNIQPGQPFRARVNLERWTNMAALGWYSGDGHVHAERATSEINELIATWAAAENVAFCNVLRMGDEQRTYYEQYAYGAQGRYLNHGTALAPGQEDPRTAELGHSLHLDLAAPVRFPDRYSDYEPIFSRARRDGALSGFAHAGRQHWSFHAERALTLLAPLGLVDFVEIAQMGYIGVQRWFDFLNLGFRLTAMAGSDVPWGGTLGNTRVYAYAGRQFSPEAWFEAVRRGRTFVTTGPMLEFTANGAHPGSLLKLSRGQKIHVSARAWGWGPHQPETAEIIVSGETLGTATRHEGQEFVTVALDFPASRGVWVTALARTAPGELTGPSGFFQGAIATPVYIQVEGEPWIHQKLASKLVGDRLNDLTAIEEWLGEDRAASLREAMGRARRYYRAIEK